MKKAIILLILLFIIPTYGTVPDGETVRQSFACNGADTTFTFTFSCNSSDDVLVYAPLTSTGDPIAALTIDTDYTIAPTGDSYLNGGVVTISPALASTYTVKIVRRIKLSQETSQGAITPTSIVASLDKLTRQAQDAEDRKDRSLHLPDSDSTSFDMTIPNPVDRAGKVLNFDGSGNVGVISGTDTFTVVNGSYDTIATSNLVTKNPWFDITHPDFGATGSDGIDDTEAIQTAIDAAELVNGTVFIPPGTFNFTNLVISTSMKMTGAGTVFRWRGASTSILQHTGVGDAITMDNATTTQVGSITLSNFELIPSASGAGANGISMVHSNAGGGAIQGVLLDNLSIRNFGGHCIYGSGTVFDITIRRVFTITSTDDCVKVVAGIGQPSQWRFIDCFSISTAAKWCYNIASEQTYFGSGTVSGNGHGIFVNGTTKITGMNIEGTNVASSVGLQFKGNNCVVDGTVVFKWDVGVKIGDGGADNARGFDFTGDLTGNDTADIQLTSGGNRKYAYVKNLGVAQGSGVPVVDNEREDGAEAFGELFVFNTGKTPIARVSPVYYAIPALADDATPSVLGSETWLTGGNTTVTDFDDGVQGQRITIIAGALTTTTLTITDGTNIFLNGGANFTMTATDTLTLVQKADGKWYEAGRSQNASTGLSLTLTTKVELSSANILALNATPITLVAAQGADTVVEFISAVLVHDAAVAYVEPSAPDDMVIEYATGTDVSGSIDATGFLTVTDDEIRRVPTTLALTVDLVPEKNSAIQLLNTGGEYTTGTGTMTIFVTYRVHTLGL